MKRCGLGRAWVWGVLLLACGEPSSDTDAGLDDEGADAEVAGPLRIEGPAYPFVSETACYRAVPTPSDAIVSVVWGDGARDTAAPGVSELCHTFAYPGPLVIGMTVQTGALETSATSLVHVVFRPRALPVTRSSSIAFDAATNRVWAVEPDADVVVSIDAGSGEVIERIAVGDRPRTLALEGSRVIVACEDGTLHAIGPTHEVLSLGRGSGLFGVVVDPRGANAFVSLMRSGEVASVSLDTPVPTELARLGVGRDPRALAMRDDGLLVVTHWRANQEGNALLLVDGSTPDALALASETLLPREEGRDADTDNDGVLSFVDALVMAPDGGRVIAGGLKANIVAGLARTGLPLTSQTTARGALAEVLLEGIDAPGIDSLRRPLDDLDAIAAFVLSPFGETLYAAVPGAEVVLATDAFSFDTAGSIDDVGHAVDGLALDAEGRTLFVHAALSREVRAYDVTDLSREPTPSWTASTVEVEPLAPEVLAGAILFARSRDARMSRTRYLSCASCHRDGAGDNLVWDFTQRGEGLRNTIVLSGRRGTGNGPIHWSANFDEVQDFEHDIRNAQGGTGFLPDALFHVGTRDTTLGDPKAGLSPELDALAAYLSSFDHVGISPHRREDATWEASRARGEALFAARGCSRCHSGPDYTDSAFTSPGVPRLHDVGTLRPSSGSRLGGALTGIDTPTLRGLFSTAPYFHDGSAATLDDVLTRDLGDRHGTTSDLSVAERQDLVTFLLSLDDLAP